MKVYINSKSFKLLNRPLIDLFLLPTDQYLALIAWMIASIVRLTFVLTVFDH